MKIRYVYDQFLPSRDTDTEQVLNTVTALGRRGVEVELVIPRNAERPVDAEALRSYYQVRGPFSISEETAGLGVSRPLQKTLHGFRGSRHRTREDVLYTRNLHAVAWGLYFGHRVVYEHFRPWADQYPPLEPVLRAMLRHPRFLGAVLHSRHTAASYARLGLAESELLVAHNGYEPARMEPRLSARAARVALELPLDRPLVVYTGRVNERKGLLEVLALARRIPHAVFVFVGSESEGIVEREARQLANVVVRPWQRFDTTVQYLYAADVLMIPPSLAPLERHGNTVLPMKLFLYLASGRVIYAPRAPDTAELLEHDVNAVLVPAEGADIQARELEALLGDGSRRDRLAAAALQASSALTWDSRAEKIERFLQSRLTAPERTPVPDGWSALAWLRQSARWLASHSR